MRILDIEELKTLSEKLKVGCENLPMSLADGLMGRILFFYFIYRKFKDDVCLEIADTLLDCLIDGLNCDFSFDFEKGLPGIGYGIEYLVQNEFVEGDTYIVLNDFDILFRKKLLSGGCTLAEIVGISFYFAMRSKSDNSGVLDGMEEKRLKHNGLLCLNRLDEVLRTNEKLNVSYLLQIFAVLIDFYQQNLPRFRIANLLERLLFLFQIYRPEMSKEHQLHLVGIFDVLFATDPYIDNTLLSSLRKTYNLFIGTFGLIEDRAIGDKLPCVLISEGQIYLLTECQNWILLSSKS